MSDGDNITKLKFGRKSLRVAIDATFAVQFLHWLDHHPRGGEISVEQRRRVIAALLMPVPDDE